LEEILFPNNYHDDISLNDKCDLRFDDGEYSIRKKHTLLNVNSIDCLKSVIEEYSIKNINYSVLFNLKKDYEKELTKIKHYLELWGFSNE
jgi:hypothetical protein